MPNLLCSLLIQCITTPDRSAAGAPTLKIEREEHTDDSDAADL